MAGLFTRNRVSGAPAPANRLAGQPASGQEASAVYDGFYGQMPIPATAYALSDTPLRSLDDQPSVVTVASNASVVDRHNRRKGLDYTGGRLSRKAGTPQMLDPVFSSQYQPWLFGPQVNFVINEGWYIAYPAASVMFGGLRNQGLSTKVSQLPTRTTGGPGPGAMSPAPRFKAVQTVPRYSTMPPMYNTQSTQG